MDSWERGVPSAALGSVAGTVFQETPKELSVSPGGLGRDSVDLALSLLLL